MFCSKCGTQLPDDASFCFKCGTSISGGSSGQTSAPKTQNVLAPSGVTTLKCPSCGAPISPKFGEMIITCEYCGSSVTLGNEGWTNIQKQTMLPLKVATVDQLNAIIHPMMDKGLLHRHIQETSKQEEMSLSYVPYWVVEASARTSVISVNMAAQVGQTATEAALFGVILGGMSGGFGRRAFWNGNGIERLFEGGFLGSMMAGFGGMGYGGGGIQKTEQMDENYNYPVVALKALSAYQPRDYSFSLEDRTLFDISKIPKGIKVLNGDISEDAARSQAKTLVDQLQSEKAHEKYHMIQRLNTEVDIGDVELLHAPIWFAKYDHKGNKIILVIDANSGRIINSLGL